MVAAFDQPWVSRQLVLTQRIRQRRTELGFTQQQVVTRLARLGVLTSNRALSSLEHGAGLDVAKLPELAQVLDCTVTYLLGLTGDPHSWTPEVQHADASATPMRARSGILGADVPERRRR